MVDSYEQTLQLLIDGGAADQKTWALIALDKSKARTNDRAGNVAFPSATWGPRMKFLEFEAQDVSFGDGK